MVDAENMSDEPSSGVPVSASPAADVEAEVARILAMSDEEIMAEPGAARAARWAGKIIARAVALHDIRTVRNKLQAAYDDQSGAPGYRNFCGSLAEILTGALTTLAARQSLTGQAQDGSSQQNSAIHPQGEDAALPEPGRGKL